MSVIIGTCVTYCLCFGVSKIFIFHVQYTSIIVIFCVQTPFMIIIHVSVHLGLSSITIISHIQYAPIIIIIDVNLIIFHNGAWIFLGSNTINENLIPSLRYRCTTPLYKCVIIVASSLQLTFVDKIRDGTVSHLFLSGPPRCGIGFLFPWTPERIGIIRHRPSAYIIIL